MKKIQIVKVNFVDFFFFLNFGPSNINKHFVWCVTAYQTELCGWGVVAAEPISKGDFVVEYVGEGKFF